MSRNPDDQVSDNSLEVKVTTMFPRKAPPSGMIHHLAVQRAVLGDHLCGGNRDVRALVPRCAVPDPFDQVVTVADLILARRFAVLAGLTLVRGFVAVADLTLVRRFAAVADLSLALPVVVIVAGAPVRARLLVVLAGDLAHLFDEVVVLVQADRALENDTRLHLVIGNVLSPLAEKVIHLDTPKSVFLFSLLVEWVGVDGGWGWGCRVHCTDRNSVRMLDRSTWQLSRKRGKKRNEMRKRGKLERQVRPSPAPSRSFWSSMLPVAKALFLHCVLTKSHTYRHRAILSLGHLSCARTTTMECLQKN